MKYEWDGAKQRANVIKHSIDFADAKEVFDDPAGYMLAARHQSDEQRFVAVGLMKGMLVAVVFTRRGDVIRIISARAARRSERKIYGAETTKKKS
jgi:uncharacterized DUF497 family protein